ITIQPSHHDDCPTPHIDQPSPSDNALRSGRKHAQLYHQSDDLYKGLRNLNQRLRRLLPFLWPRNQLRMQFLIGLLTLLLAAGRIVNILVPYQLKFMIDGLSSPHHPPSFSWIVSQIGFFTLLKLLQGNSGVISTLQNFVWVPVGQYTTKRISVDMFDHLHRLSFRFHINRKTGEILRVQDRGVASVVSVLTSILFNITPTLLDIVLAAYVFGVTFDRYFGVIVLVTMVVYISLTVIMTDWRTRYRRLANQLDNEMEARAVDSLLNFETVKYYNAEPFEIKEYADAVDNYQYAEWKSNLTMNVLNIVQTFTIQAGLAIGALLCARRVLDGRVSVGSFVMYLTYITQLYGPLSWFGSYYRVIQKNFIDMEKMFELFEEPVEIKDAVDSRPLRLDRGEVEFRNVSFTYDSGGQGNSPMTLSNISFKVPAGSTVALVGPSGSGKSTILRLLFRFYDIQSGSILIDGQDIRDVPQNDVRRAIGVVPQDTVLFNDTIRYNIAYGKAGDPTGHVNMDDVVSASRMAQIHDRVIRFPDRYESKVGERGLRLSGGEKQRVAIARTLLKDPAIVCLDEATSALDTQTERNIQSSLREMTADRTTLIIAHRLSTVIHADQILVLHRGRIVERGTHQELLDNPNSMYRDMWMKQLRDEDGVRLCADGASGNNGGSGSSSSSSSNNSSSNNGGGGDNKLTLQHQLCQNNDSEGARATVTLLLQQQPKDQALRSGDLPPVAPITKVVAAAVEAGMAVTTVSTKRNPAGASD
ncbi:ATP-binding cassette-type vacuolar membrane transporter Hmt1, partial [Spiromyces aspiralis]